MTPADVILPLTAATETLWYAASVALRTLRDSCDARVLALMNNTPEGKLRDSIIAQCKSLNIECRYIDGPFSLSRFWNLGRSLTSSEYIAYANQDCIYFRGWLDNMIELWREEPDYYALWPWSLCDHDMGIAYPQKVQYERRILRHHHPATLLLMRLDSGYVWDEQFNSWEMDADFIRHVESKGLKIGMCLNSRVDHFSSFINSNVDIEQNYGSEDFYDEATERLRKKWNL